MSANSPVWLSLTENAFDDDSGRPVLTGGISRRLKLDRAEENNANIHRRRGRTSSTSFPEIPGLRRLPRMLVERIFLAAAHDSRYTRDAILKVCKNWKWVCEDLRELWSHIRLMGSSSSFIPEICKNRAVIHQSTPLHIQLSNPGPDNLEYLVRRTSTDQWESLEITLGSDTTLTESRCFEIFEGCTFFGLKSLKIVEDKVVDSSRRDCLGDFDVTKIDDPYSGLYDAIFLTAVKLTSVFVDADLSSVANGYRLFGQRVSSVGGSSSFIQSALPPPPEYEESPYPYVHRLTIYHWDHEFISNIALPHLSHLEVTHCSLPDPRTLNNPPLTVFLPSLRVLRVNRHSMKILPQICAGRLLSLAIDEFDGYGPQDDCLPYTRIFDLATFDMDRWTSTSVERVVINIPVSSASLNKFLKDAHGLVSLTLRIPNDKIWRADFVKAMTNKELIHSEYDDFCDIKITHCMALQHLCILMNWRYSEADWLWDMRAIYDRRREAGLKSMICRWNGDSRQVESGPADCYMVGPLEPVGFPTEQEQKPVRETEIIQNKEEEKEEEKEDEEDELLEEWQTFENTDGPHWSASQVERRSISPSSP